MKQPTCWKSGLRIRVLESDDLADGEVVRWLEAVGLKPERMMGKDGILEQANCKQITLHDMGASLISAVRLDKDKYVRYIPNKVLEAG